MKLLEFLTGAIVVGTALAAPAGDSATPTTKRKRAGKFQWAGINESGAEFGNKNLPGRLDKDYTWPVHSSIDVSFSPSSIQGLD